jgi:hypothetical protein
MQLFARANLHIFLVLISLGAAAHGLRADATPLVDDSATPALTRAPGPELTPPPWPETLATLVVEVLAHPEWSSRYTIAFG